MIPFVVLFAFLIVPRTEAVTVLFAASGSPLTGLIGTREEANGICAAGSQSLACGNIQAFLGYPGDPSLYAAFPGVNITDTVMDTQGRILAQAWDRNLDYVDLTQSFGVMTWSGFTPQGILGDTCSGWTSENSSLLGTSGEIRLSRYRSRCSSRRTLLCVCGSRPTAQPTQSPTTATAYPTASPTQRPSKAPTTSRPSQTPSRIPTVARPSEAPSIAPTTSLPSAAPSATPSRTPSVSPTPPTESPTESPTYDPVLPLNFNVIYHSGIQDIQGNFTQAAAEAVCVERVAAVPGAAVGPCSTPKAFVASNVSGVVTNLWDVLDLGLAVYSSTGVRLASTGAMFLDSDLLVSLSYAGVCEGAFFTFALPGGEYDNSSSCAPPENEEAYDSFTRLDTEASVGACPFADQSAATAFARVNCNVLSSFLCTCQGVRGTFVPTASPTAPTAPTPPTSVPTTSPTLPPTSLPTRSPSRSPSKSPSRSPSRSPSQTPSVSPSTSAPTHSPTKSPTIATANPTTSPSPPTTKSPTVPTSGPTKSPSRAAQAPRFVNVVYSPSDLVDGAYTFGAAQTLCASSVAGSVLSGPFIGTCTGAYPFMATLNQTIDFRLNYSLETYGPTGVLLSSNLDEFVGILPVGLDNSLAEASVCPSGLFWSMATAGGGMSPLDSGCVLDGTDAFANATAVGRVGSCSARTGGAMTFDSIVPCSNTYRIVCTCRGFTL